MKRILLFGLFFLTFSVFMNAQGQGERVEAMRVAFITQHLDLSPEESANFWPLYNEYKSKTNAIKKSIRDAGDINNMSDSELESLLDRRFDAEQEELNIKREYFKKMRSVLPIRKIARLTVAEKKFKERVLTEIKKRREQRMQRRKGM